MYKAHADMTLMAPPPPSITTSGSQAGRVVDRWIPRYASSMTYNTAPSRAPRHDAAHLELHVYPLLDLHDVPRQLLL